MQMKYLLSIFALTFLMGAACQKDAPPTTSGDVANVPNISEESVTPVCQGTPAECFSECTKMAVALDKENCYLRVFSNQTKDICEQLSDQTLCLDYFKWQESLAGSECGAITTDLWQARCFESFADTQAVFNEADFDGDGLSNAKEMEIGTDFRKADTDGDGFSDYDEVQEGYDPLTAIKK